VNIYRTWTFFISSCCEVVICYTRHVANICKELGAPSTTLLQPLFVCLFVYCCVWQAARRAQSDAETLKLRNQDLERIERQARVDIEQLSKRVRHPSRLAMYIHATFTYSPGGGGVRATTAIIFQAVWISRRRLLTPSLVTNTSTLVFKYFFFQILRFMIPKF